MPTFRSGTDDEAFWASAQVEYNLPEFDPEDRVIDLGCSIGGVTNAFYDHGCRYIYAYEACPDNYELAMKNVGHLKGVHLHHLAVMAPSRPKSMDFPRGNNSFFIPEHEKVPVPTTTLDRIIETIGYPIRFLKIDIEGAEWEVLYTSSNLDEIDEISGEYHEPGSSWWDLKQNPNLPDYNWQTLQTYLKEFGFKTEFTPPGEGCAPPILSGAFHAWR